MEKKTKYASLCSTRQPVVGVEVPKPNKKKKAEMPSKTL